MIRLKPEDGQTPQIEVHAQQDAQTAHWRVTASILKAGLPGRSASTTVRHRHQLDAGIADALTLLGYTADQQESLRGTVLVKPIHRPKMKRMGET